MSKEEEEDLLSQHGTGKLSRDLAMWMCGKDIQKHSKTRI
jgi:hypothetical protein